MKKIVCIIMAAMLCMTAFVGCGKSEDESSSKTEPSVKIVKDNEGFWNMRIGMSLNECINTLGEFSEKKDGYDRYYWYFDEVNSFKTIEDEPKRIEPIVNKYGYRARIEVSMWDNKVQSITYDFNYVGSHHAAEIFTKLVYGEEYSTRFEGSVMIDTVPNHSKFGAQAEIINNVNQNQPSVLIHKAD